MGSRRILNYYGRQQKSEQTQNYTYQINWIDQGHFWSQLALACGPSQRKTLTENEKT